MLMNIITETDRYLFGNGLHYEIYEKMGAHVMEIDGVKGTYFAVWAPNAKAVSVVGNFNDWNGYENIMHPLATSGIWEAFVPGADVGEIYKYAITGRDGQTHYKADPYGNGSEFRPGNASKITDIQGFKWSDKAWLEKQTEEVKDIVDRPISIYEVHIGSWKKDYSYSSDGFRNYREIAKDLAEYVKDMGYTHVELMGISEHPLDASWGYQVTGYYCPTSRYGDAKDFMYFIDYMHKNGIGVILDWVPAHFPKDEHGLAMFDGTPLYEYADPRKGEQKDWGTKIFDYGKSEVVNFLVANALFWVEKFHVDALRVDAVASMLYLDYGRKAGEWVPNKYGGNGNLEAMEFFRHVNSILHTRAPRAYLIAEESTSWPNITKSPEEGGLGFKFKWNMGWMHDFLDYMQLDPYFRRDNHNKMTFNMTYAFSENFILVLSHDEVVHLKKSLFYKMPGTIEEKAENLKSAYAFMIGQPGKKLLFMGQDFGQREEWSEERGLDWYLLDEPVHAGIQKYFKKLLHLYKENPVMYAYESKEYDCFRWINPNDRDKSVFSFIRKAPGTYNDSLVFICNFTPVEREEYVLGAPVPGEYKRVLSSVDIDGVENVSYTAEPADPQCDYFDYCMKVRLRPFETIILATPKTIRKPVRGKRSVSKRHAKTKK